MIVLCAGCATAPSLHLHVQECPPAEFTQHQIEDLPKDEGPILFTTGYMLFWLADGTEFGHSVECLCLFDPSQTNVTYIVCDSVGWTEPVNYRFVSPDVVEFDIAQMHDGIVLGSASFDRRTRRIKTRKAQQTPASERLKAPPEE